MRVENGKIVYQGDWYEFSSRPDDACPIERSAPGTKPTYDFATAMSAYDPKRTFRGYAPGLASAPVAWP